jgi:hypothetical protein
MEYKVIPFVASIDANKGTAVHVAEQLSGIVSYHADHGWKYVRLESVITYVQPDNGCFGLGGKPGYTTSRQMIVFSKE